MAKKKHAKKEEPASAGKPSGSTGWIIAAIVVIVIIVLLVSRGGKEDVIEEKEEVVVAPEPEAGELQAAEAPEFDKKCTIAGGVVPGSKTVEGNVVTVTYKNAARVANEGTYFEFSDVEGNKVYRKNTEAVEGGSTIEYTVSLDDAAQQLGASVKRFVIFPIQGGKACLNQPAFVIR